MRSLRVLFAPRANLSMCRFLERTLKLLDVLNTDKYLPVCARTVDEHAQHASCASMAGSPELATLNIPRSAQVSRR